MLHHLLTLAIFLLLAAILLEVRGMPQGSPAAESFATLPEDFEFACTPGQVGIFADTKYNCQVSDPGE